jgi:hypothetical protein
VDLVSGFDDMQYLDHFEHTTIHFGRPANHVGHPKEDFHC